MTQTNNHLTIQHFIQLVKTAELSQQREVKISIQQARLLNLALVDILNQLNQDKTQIINEIRDYFENQSITITMDGGSFEE